MDQMHEQGTWPLPKKASNTELVEIFFSKSYWHSHVVKGFSAIASYPEMVGWLEREDSDYPSDMDVWHVQKSDYGFRELADWIANGGTLDKAVKRNLEKGKGKKGKAKAKEGRKAKAVEESDEEGTEFEEDKMEIEKGGKSKKGKASGSSKKTHKRK